MINDNDMTARKEFFSSLLLDSFHVRATSLLGPWSLDKTWHGQRWVGHLSSSQMPLDGLESRNDRE